MRPALLIQHGPLETAGFIAERAAHHGLRIQPFHVIERYEDLDVRVDFPDPEPYALVVMTGAPWSVYDEAVATWMAEEYRFLRRVHNAGIPFLGTCYGAQAMAVALGGSCTRLPAGEVGWYQVDSCEPGVLAGPWFQWHHDGFTVPPGATELARTDLCSQAFRLGRSMGLQFHPEVDAALVDSWCDASRSELAAAGLTKDEVLAPLADPGPARNRASRLFDWFWRHATLPG
jgi:GMP synthase-like glutamine amidotransferase